MRKQVFSEMDVYNLLKQACNDTTDMVSINHRIENFIADAYTESGIQRLGILPYTIIEIKNRLLPNTIYYVTQICQRYQSNIHHAIIVFLEDGERDYRNTRNEFDIKVWSIKELQEKSAQIKSSGNNLPSNVSWIEKAHADFNKGRNTLVLGAGVGKYAGLPLWKDLLKDIIEDVRAKDIKLTLEQLSEPCGNSSIIIAQYLSEIIKPQDISGIVKRILQNYKHRVDNDLHESIVNMIKTKRVTEVLTYNYDDLLEDALDRCIDTRDKYYTIYDNNHEINDKLPIYHLHGFVPLNVKRESIHPNPILLERDYHQLYKNSCHWSNVALLHALNTSTCFFVGLSMQDPNMRRILDFYADEYSNGRNQVNIQHYVLLLREILGKGSSLADNERHWHNLEEMYKKWNIKVIWLDGFTDIPVILNRISQKI